jgi:MFS family permease
MIVGPGPILVFSYAVILRPATQELGVDRSVFSSAALIATLIELFGGPTVGWLIDRYGARRVMIPGILLFALAIAANFWLSASTAALFALFAGTLVVACVLFLTLGANTSIRRSVSRTPRSLPKKSA